MSNFLLTIRRGFEASVEFLDPFGGGNQNSPDENIGEKEGSAKDKNPWPDVPDTRAFRQIMSKGIVVGQHVLELDRGHVTVDDFARLPTNGRE